MNCAKARVDETPFGPACIRTVGTADGGQRGTFDATQPIGRNVVDHGLLRYVVGSRQQQAHVQLLLDGLHGHYLAGAGTGGILYRRADYPGSNVRSH